MCQAAVTESARSGLSVPATGATIRTIACQAMAMAKAACRAGGQTRAVAHARRVARCSLAKAQLMLTRVARAASRAGDEAWNARLAKRILADTRATCSGVSDAALIAVWKA
jgi:hypothetical protein